MVLVGILVAIEDRLDYLIAIGQQSQSAHLWWLRLVVVRVDLEQFLDDYPLSVGTADQQRYVLRDGAFGRPVV